MTTTDPTRVVIVHSSDDHYGSDRVLLDVLRVVDRRPDTHVDVILPDDVPHGDSPLCTSIVERHPAVTVEHLPVPVLRRTQQTPLAMMRLARRCIRLSRRLRNLRPDLVWCATSAALPVAVSARIAGIPSIVVHVHEIWSGPSGHMLRALARLTTGHVAVSAAVEQAIRLPSRPGTIALNAVPLPTSTGATRTAVTPLRFLVASRWGWWKGHTTLLTAWERAGAPGHLTILGARPPTGGGVDVARLAGSTRSISVIGEVSDIGPFLDSTDVLILPSERPEPFGLVIIEAFARGVPVIATRAGGVPEIVTDGVDGWLVEPACVDALAERLATLRPDEVARAGIRAAATHRARFVPAMFDTAINQLMDAQLNRAQLNRARLNPARPTRATADTTLATPQRRTRM